MTIPFCSPQARQDILIIGVGNTLREDDGVGIKLVCQLNRYFSFQLNCLEVCEPDVILAQYIAEFENLLIVDAMLADDDAPCKIIPVEPAKQMIPSVGFVTHIFDWNAILAIAEEFFGNSPKTELLGISASRFGFCESLSALCSANAEKAFQFLIRYCSR